MVNVADADTFFTELREQVKALEEFSRPHPLSTGTAVTMLKKYLSESKYHIAHDDLVTREVDGVTRVVTRDSSFDMKSQDMSGISVLNRLRKYEAVSTTLIHMGFVAGQWSDGDQATSWANAIVMLSLGQTDGNTLLWQHLQRYPATLLLYAFGLGTVARERWQTLSAVLNMHILQKYKEDKHVATLTPICALFDKKADSIMQCLPGREKEHTPLNNHVEQLLWEQIGMSFPSKLAFQLAFDKLEVLLAMSYAVVSAQEAVYYDGRTIPGIYGWDEASRKRVFAELRLSLKSEAEASSLVSSGLVGATAAAGLDNLSQLENFVDSLRWRQTTRF